MAGLKLGAEGHAGVGPRGDFPDNSFFSMDASDSNFSERIFFG